MSIGLDGIQAEPLGELLSIVAFPETPEERDAAEAAITSKVAGLLATVGRVEGVAEWIRDNHGDYISREIEDRIRAAITEHKP